MLNSSKMLVNQKDNSGYAGQVTKALLLLGRAGKPAINAAIGIYFAEEGKNLPAYQANDTLKNAANVASFDPVFNIAGDAL